MIIASPTGLNTSQTLLPQGTTPKGLPQTGTGPSTETGSNIPATPISPTPALADSQISRVNDPLRPSTVQALDGGGNQLTPQQSPTVAGQTDPDSEQSNTARSQTAQPNANPDLDDPQVQAQLRELARIDREVRAHEAAHAAVGGSLAGAPSFSYTRGPDGQLYATGGEVSIDSPQASTPEQTAERARTVIAAALAPANPSPQDLRVAAQARAQLITAQAEIARLEQESSEPAERPVASEAVVETVAADETDLSAETVVTGSDEEGQQAERFQQQLEEQQARAERIRQQQQAFQQELAELNARIQLIQQQLIETGEVDPISLLQGTLLDTQA